eukprot:4657197-Amphidinium_carterae.1
MYVAPSTSWCGFRLCLVLSGEGLKLLNPFTKRRYQVTCELRAGHLPWQLLAAAVQYNDHIHVDDE